MILLNDDDNPTGISYNGTTLDNVYFNGTLVWSKSNPDSGTTPIPGGTSSYVDVPAADVPAYSGGKSAAPDTLSTVRINYGPSRYISFNDLTKHSDVGYYKDTGDDFIKIGTGALYLGTMSMQLVFNTSDWRSPHNGEFVIFDSGTIYGAEYISWSGIPSSMKLMDSGFGDPYSFTNEFSVTCNARLSGGGTVQRSYTCDLYVDLQGVIYLIGHARGDESEIAPATSGYLYQGDAMLWLMNK